MPRTSKSEKQASEKLTFLLIVGGVMTSIFLLVLNPPDVKWGGFKGDEPADPTAPWTKVELVQGQKTLWDWMSVVLAPATLAVLGYWFQASLERTKAEREQLEKERDEKAEELANKQAQEEKVRVQERVENEQREGALEAYLADMSDLLVGKGLSALAKKKVKGLLGEEEQFLLDAGLDVIRARTLSILRRLTDRKDSELTDGVRKASVLLFLYESELIQRKVVDHTEISTDNRESSLMKKSLLNLKGADLSDAHLSHMNLSHADISGVNLTRANLSHADLRGTYFIDTNLSYADFSDSHLMEANFKGSQLNYTRLSRADLSRANLSSTHLSSANLSGADLIDAHLIDAHLSNADLSHAHLSGADLKGSYLIDAQLTSADLSDTDLSRANLSRARLSGARLSRSRLSGVDLNGAELSNVHCSGADLSYANLSHVNLSHADLSRTQLHHVDLSHADLSYADLSHADLSSAYLRDTKLSGAHFRDTNLKRAILFAIDLSHAGELTQQQLKGEEKEDSPLLCNVELPAGILGDRNRDCDRLPSALHNRYPDRFKTIEEAIEFVKKRRNQWD